MTWVHDLELSNIIASTLRKKGNDEIQSGSHCRCSHLLMEPRLHKRAWKVIQELWKGWLPYLPPRPPQVSWDVIQHLLWAWALALHNLYKLGVNNFISLFQFVAVQGEECTFTWIHPASKVKLFTTLPKEKKTTIHIGMFAFRPEILSSGKTAVPPAPPAGRWRQSPPPARQSGWWARSGARCGHRGLPASLQSPPSSRSLRRLQSYKRQETREVNDGMQISLGTP